MGLNNEIIVRNIDSFCFVLLPINYVFVTNQSMSNFFFSLSLSLCLSLLGYQSSLCIPLLCLLHVTNEVFYSLALYRRVDNVVVQGIFWLHVEWSLHVLVQFFYAVSSVAIIRKKSKFHFTGEYGVGFNV